VQLELLAVISSLAFRRRPTQREWRIAGYVSLRYCLSTVLAVESLSSEVVLNHLSSSLMMVLHLCCSWLRTASFHASCEHLLNVQVCPGVPVVHIELPWLDPFVRSRSSSY
jgi:hypothetical protein